MFKNFRDKIALSGITVLMIGVALLIVTFLSAYGFLTQSLSIIASARFGANIRRSIGAFDCHLHTHNVPWSNGLDRLAINDKRSDNNHPYATDADRCSTKANPSSTKTITSEGKSRKTAERN